jgi:arylsulfatase A-like enzyme
LTDRLTDEAIKLIDASGREPFFLYLAHHAPHTPVEGKPALVAKYQRKLAAGLKHQNAVYAAMVESLDESAGRVRAHLRQRGLDRNTVVIVTSDNGGFINEFAGAKVTDNSPLRSGKGSLYEGGVRVPLLVYWPGVTRAGSVSSEPVVTTDLFRTICEMAGQPAPAGDGLSLVPLLRNPEARLAREEFYFHYPHYYATTTPVSAIRTREWKLLEYFEDSRLELYHLGRDPGEEQDLAAKNPEKVRELRARLEAWRQQVGARLPKPNPQYRHP